MVVPYNKNLKRSSRNVTRRGETKKKKFTAINFELKLHKFSYRSKSTSTESLVCCWLDSMLCFFQLNMSFLIGLAKGLCWMANQA
jgi:hypothetical protein